MIMIHKLLLLLLSRVDLFIQNAMKVLHHEERTTKLLVEVSRHGARSPSKIYPFTVDPAENF